LKHKYGAVKTTTNCIKFDSKLEAAYYNHLLILKRVGEIILFLRQPVFHLPGATTYRADFQIFWKSGDVTFEDVKGVLTKEFIKNKKQVEDIYKPIEIIVVKKGDF